VTLPRTPRRACQAYVDQTLPERERGSGRAEAHPSCMAPQADPTASICLSRACVMGYTVITQIQGTEWRYTEWVEEGRPPWGGLCSLLRPTAAPALQFNGKNPKSMNWGGNYGTEVRRAPRPRRGRGR
jgi:hypothetical protein